MKTIKKLTINKGFTMSEIIVSIALFTIAILLVGSMYILAQRSYNKGSIKGELVQNIRVCLDRISREIRQSVNIITALPETNDDLENPPAEEIFFQDGHNINQITYLRYYLNDTDLMRSHIAYYFDEEPETYVTWDSVDQFGDPPEKLILTNRIVGEYFNTIQFWGADNLIHISIKLTKNQNTVNIDTSVYCRN
ncbi:MAG: prepilin-type N-terminal cleavage/methylation domain-containing protein [Patescibacteria group bacterium]|nr:prepilin-type N-terminal cleavage/methylation domain-containing protein [Patescibacteria group bacterium]